MIITEETKLRLMCEEVKTITEGEEIGAQLLKELTESENGIGLAANQIGINKQVCLIVTPMKDYGFFLFNPKIVGWEGEIKFLESCVSFPDKTILTKRHASIMVTSKCFDENIEALDLQDHVNACICWVPAYMLGAWLPVGCLSTFWVLVYLLGVCLLVGCLSTCWVLP